MFGNLAKKLAGKYGYPNSGNSYKRNKALISKVRQCMPLLPPNPPPKRRERNNHAALSLLAHAGQRRSQTDPTIELF